MLTQEERNGSLMNDITRALRNELHLAKRVAKLTLTYMKFGTWHRRRRLQTALTELSEASAERERIELETLAASTKLQH